MKKKHKLIDAENELANGTILNNEDEINIERPYKINEQSISIPLHQRKIQFFEYDFLKSYLFGLYTKMLKDPAVEITTFLTPISQNNLGITLPTVHSKSEKDLPILTNDIIHTALSYKGRKYQMSLFQTSSPEGLSNNIRFIVSVTGTEASANQGILLADYLIKRSLMKSRFKNKILKLRFDYEQRIDITELSINEFREDTFNKLFAPANIMYELERFVKCLKNYDQIKFGMRFLCAGAPGTGKTKASRIIANLCYNKATIIFADGFINFNSLFEFGNLFEPAIIIIDDIDLCFGNREMMFSASGLSEFLGTLDLVDNNCFLITTTNDKGLVDAAAKRPGRYDAILDFQYLNKDNYIDIVKANTNDEEIITLFDEDILRKLGKQKVVGAFVVNLVKQMKIIKKLYPNDNLSVFIKQYVDISHKGFYKNNNNELDGLGF